MQETINVYISSSYLFIYFYTRPLLLHNMRYTQNGQGTLHILMNINTPRCFMRWLFISFHIMFEGFANGLKFKN